MAEEVIRMQETGTEPVKAAEPMGTVISMEAVKPAAESTVLQQGTEGVQDLKEAEKPVEMDIQVQPLEEPRLASEAMGHTGPESAGGDRSFKDSDREKKRISDFFNFKKDIEDFTREDWILSRLPAEDLMEYLTMEQKKSEALQKAKEIKEKRIFTTIQIAISMAAIVGVVALLKDNPTVLVNILYIPGFVIAWCIWSGKLYK